MDVNGDNLQVLVQTPRSSGIELPSPVFSPNGQSIAKATSGGADIGFVRPGGT
jgi:hypothetical protein